MTQIEILEELKKLALPERLRVIEAALRLVRVDIQHEEKPLNEAERTRQLTAAADALLADYSSDGELTVFTALDSEDFHAQG